MTCTRVLRWVAVVVFVAAAVATPASAERAELTVECPGVQSPDGYDATNSSVPTVMPILSGELVPYDEAGADVVVSVTNDEARQPQRIYSIDVTYKGIKSRLTTAPRESGGHENRTPGPGETGSGVFSIVSQADGVYLSLQQAASGSANWFVWRIGPSCATPAAPPADAPAVSAPPAAAPVEGASTYTG